MKLYTAGVLTLTMSCLFLPASALAGALDRGPMQQRYNPAAEDMLRVPGVVGMYEQDAMATLQQAGLAPEIRYDKNYRENLAGKEGTVISQDPGAAGVAMLGSIVSVRIYWPPSAGEIPDNAGYGDPYGNQGGGQWEDSDSGNPSSYQEPAPQWGSGGLPDNGGGWAPPPAPAPYAAPEPAVSEAPRTPIPAVSPQGGTGRNRIPPPVVPRVPVSTTPVTSRPPLSDETPIQRQLDTKVPARADIRDKIKGAGRKFGPRSGGTAGGGGGTGPSVNSGVTPAIPAPGQNSSVPLPIVATPVQQTVTPVTTAPSNEGSAVPITMTPVNQSVTLTEAPTQDGSCRSWYAIAVDITAEAQRIAKELGCAAVQPPAVWKACIKHIDKIGKWNAYNFQLKKRWNRLVKKTSWAAIGPRDLTFGKTHKGRLFGTTGRMFITPAPINKESVNILLKKKAGKSRTSVTVCSYMPGGDRIKEWQFESPRGNRNKGQVWTRDLSDMEGKLLSIHLDGKSTADTFQYSVFLKGN